MRSIARPASARSLPSAVMEAGFASRTRALQNIDGSKDCRARKVGVRWHLLYAITDLILHGQSRCAPPSSRGLSSASSWRRKLAGEAFRKEMRVLLGRIKARHGTDSCIHDW